MQTHLVAMNSMLDSAADNGPALMALVRQLRAHLGAAVLRVQQDANVDAERYRITRMLESKKEDVRRNDDNGAGNVVQMATQVEPARLPVKAGDFYVPMDQPLANMIAAVLEPDTQSSYAANRVLALPTIDAAQPAFLPLYRLPSALAASAVVYEGD